MRPIRPIPPIGRTSEHLRANKKPPPFRAMVWKNLADNLAPVAITATATAAAATISAATAATTATVAAATTAGRAFFAGTRFIHRQGPALKFLLVKLLDGCIGFRLGANFDEGKTT